MKRILILDDDVNYTPSLKVNLENTNEFQVVWNETPGEVLNELAIGNYDAIILDIMMPVPDSWENGEKRDTEKGMETGKLLFYKIRSKYPNLPILVYSAKGGFQTDQYSYYVRKPELSTVIVQQLKRLFQKLESDKK